jgi:undecaprenyl-diphosphatase
MSELLHWDKELFVTLNGFHAAWLDPVMALITNTAFWIPFYLWLGYLILRNYKSEGWLILVGAGLAILLADRITSGLLKPYFARLRPSHEPALESIIHIVKGNKGGLYGFASSHAANTFAVAMLMWLVFRKTYQWIGLIFLWAAVLTYTRIYLGLHYPGDIVVGMVIGLLSGWIGFIFYQWLKSRLDKRKSSLA